MTDEAKPYQWERDARANNAEAAVLFERTRADAAEAQAKLWQEAVAAVRAEADVLTKAYAEIEARMAEIADDDQRWIRLIEGRASRLERAEAQRDRLAAALRAWLGVAHRLPVTDQMYDSGEWKALMTQTDAALEDVPERCDHVEHVPGGGDVRCSEPAGHEEGAHMGMIRDVLAATDVPDADRRKDEAYRAMVEALTGVLAGIDDFEDWKRSHRTARLSPSAWLSWREMIVRALALARQVEE